MKMTRRGGFTLLELMIVIMVIAIFTAISIPGLQYFTERNHDLILQSQLLETIRIARQEMLARGVPVSICENKRGEGLQIFVDIEGKGIVHDQEQMITIMQMDLHRGQLFWQAYPYYRHHLRLVPIGRAATDNGMFWYCRHGNSAPVFAMAVSKSGNTRMIYPDVNNEIKDSRGRVMHCTSPAFT